MDVISDYSQYVSRIEEGDTQCVFEGELSVLNVLKTEKKMSNGSFYIWNDLGIEGKNILLKVVCDKDSAVIVECIQKDNFITALTERLNIENVNIEKTIKWWNLCYFCDEHGVIKYDPYYDKYYAANETETKVLDLQRVITQWIEDSFVGVEGLVYILGDFANCNPIIYQLQQRGLEVKTISIDNSESLSEFNERVIGLRKQLAIPYCNSDKVIVNFFTSAGVDNNLADCHNPYLIAIPIDLININDNAIGSFSYKNILPDEDFCCDYSCCDHKYSYVEMELFADLYGNTVLKTTNSNAKSKYTTINKFNYTNLQKNGQSN